MTRKAAGQRLTMDEMALYTVRDGKIVEERFFLIPN
jgi:ketosteroid isomerase-like protein